MNRTLFLLFLFLLSFDLAICQNNFPEWFRDPYSSYPKESYLVSLGEGYSRKSAEKDALGRMALIFKSEIDVQNSMYRQYEELISDEKSSLEERVNSFDGVKISSKQSLLNVKFSENFTSADGKHHVLAFIDRNETAAIYLNKIKKSGKRAFFFYNKAKAYLDPVKQFAYARAANQIVKVNDYLADKAQILKPGLSISNETLINPSEISELANDSAEKISFSVNIIGDHENSIRNSLVEFLTKEGFIVKRDDSLLKIIGNVNIKELDLPRKGVIMRWELSLDLSDDSNKIVYAISGEGKEGHITKNECESRCIKSISSLIEREYGNEMMKYFDQILINK